MEGVRRRGGAFSTNHQETPKARPLSASSSKPFAKPRPDQLGFRHWLLILLMVVVIYAVVVHLHQRMPEVKDDSDFTQFSETRARWLLKRLTALGPRPSGSTALEKHAFLLLQGRLEDIHKVVNDKGVNRMEIDVQHPTGCFDLKFLSSFSLCYYKITNIIARIGPKSGPSKHSILLNCHFDTMPDTPGATDDAVSCAILSDVLDVLAHSKQPLEHDIVFLFNGAEENFLQAAHGFIEQHPWRHTIRAFINLEGTGSGGREILFQAGPGNSWLLQNAPYPHCSVVAQEIFQAGIIPSDTDFRIFRDYGRISGLDIAYTKNGWVYHTEFDTENRIEPGAIQRSGENVLAVVRGLLHSPYLEQPAHFDEKNKWVFYDVIGLFTVFYTIEVGTIINYTVVSLVLLVVISRLHADLYSVGDLFWAFAHHMGSLIAMGVTVAVVALIVVFFDMSMCWYALPELVGPLYVLPAIIAGCTAHSVFASRTKIRNVEMVHWDSVLLVFAFLLFALTHSGKASAFFVLNYVLFPFLRDPFIFLLGKLGYVHVVTPRVIFYAQALMGIPVIAWAAYATSQCVDFFVPVMGRLGNAVQPEVVMAPLSLIIAYTFVLFTSNLVYISRRMNYLIKCALAIFVLFLVATLTTRLGVPYKFSEEHPRVRRVIALHTQRRVFDFDGKLSRQETGLFVQSLDYRGTADLPEHSFLQASEPPNCSHTKDEYCQLPYYTSIHEMLPPEKSKWVQVPAPPKIPFPLAVKLISRQKVGANMLNLTFELTGGYDKMSLHVTPLANYELKSWSFTPMDIDNFGRRNTYFVFLTYGAEKPTSRSFWFLLEDTKSQAPHNPETSENLELAVASHHAHGEHQNSDTLRQLRQLIASRRATPWVAVGWWKWAMTMIGGISEIVIYKF